MLHIPVIIQARMGSSRLPGKVMLDWRGKTYLEHVLDRCARIDGIGNVICAIPAGADCDGIAALCTRRGYRVFRGSETDALARHLGAARAARADAVMRNTSDCPLTDPALASAVLADFRRGGADLVTTNIPPSWPLGMDVEVVSMAALEAADREGTHPLDREHVTTIMRHRPTRFAWRNHPCPTEGAAYWRLTLDTPTDHAFFGALSDGFPGALETAGWDTVLPFCCRPPHLMGDQRRNCRKTTSLTASSPPRSCPFLGDSQPDMLSRQPEAGQAGCVLV